MSLCARCRLVHVNVLDVVVQSAPILKPSIYRAVIDDVIANIKPEFDEYGVSEDVLAELQHVSDVLVLSSVRTQLSIAEMGGKSHCIPCC